MLHVNADWGKKEKGKKNLYQKSASKTLHMNKKYLFFVNTNAIHNVPESGYNQIDVARIIYFCVCERVCVLFCY